MKSWALEIENYMQTLTCSGVPGYAGEINSLFNIDFADPNLQNSFQCERKYAHPGDEEFRGNVTPPREALFVASCLYSRFWQLVSNFLMTANVYIVGYGLRFYADHRKLSLGNKDICNSKIRH